MASLAHHYDDPKDAVVAPHKFMALTHYYVDRWLPELGERGHIIVTVLRRMGYLDRERDVERGGIEIEQEELAALCGLKLRTFQREFAAGDDGRPVNPALHQFVQREQQYHRNGAGRVVREKTVYVVQMRDPLHPSDQVVFQEECARREKNAAKKDEKRTEQGKTEEGAPRSRQVGGNSDARTRQYGGEARQDDARTRQYGGEARQDDARTRQYGGEARQDDARTRQYGGEARHIGGNYKVILDSYIPENTLDDTGGAPGDSTSSFPEKKEPDQDAASPWPFDLLPEADRASWLDRAERELRGNFGADVWAKTKEKGRAAIRERRAANLYLTSLRADAPRRNRAG